MERQSKNLLLSLSALSVTSPSVDTLEKTHRVCLRMRGDVVGGEVFPRAPDFQAFLDLTRQAWEPAGTPQQRPQRAGQVGSECPLVPT